jgi:YVTN family beta-propeller protein
MRYLLSAILTTGLAFAASAGAQDSIVRIIQTNYAGSNAHVIDPETNTVVDIIDNVPKAHAAVNHPDGTYYYFANEHAHQIDVVDAKTLEVVDAIPLIDRPNKLVINETHNKLYVGIRDQAFLQVISLDVHMVSKTIPVHYGIHNVYVTKDDAYVIAGLGKTPDTMDEPTIQVIDAATDEIVFGISLEGHRVRPIAIESNADGSPKRLFAQATSASSARRRCRFRSRTSTAFRMASATACSCCRINRHSGTQAGSTVACTPGRCRVWNLPAVSRSVRLRSG